MAEVKQLAKDVLAAVGGTENVAYVTHCMTRLRFNLKNENIPDDDSVKAIDGVLGVARQGGQYQVIIGQVVPKVYAELCALGNFDQQQPVDENLDEKKPLTLKGVGEAVLDYLSGSMAPLIPVIMVAGLFKTIQVVLGPTMANVLAEDSDLFTFTNMVYNAGFYFLPIYLGYTASKKLGVSQVLGMMLAGILIEPSFVEMANNGITSLSVFGLPASVVNYSQSVMPILLSVWVMSYIERFFKKVIPDTLSTVFVPFLTMLITVPIALVVTAPLGNLIGNALGGALFSAGTAGGVVSIIAMTVLMAAQPFLVITGMHVALITLAIAAYAQNGMDTFAIVCNLLSNFAVWAMAFAASLRLKNPADKAEAMGCFVSGILGGVSEPTLFGIGFKYSRCLTCAAVANVFVGLFAGIFHICFYNLGASSILCLLNFASADNPSNVIYAAVAGVIGFVISTVLCYMLGFTKEQIEGQA